MMKSLLLRVRLAGVAVAAMAMSACVLFAKPAEKIPTEFVPAPNQIAMKSLVIVLPGRGDTLAVLNKSAVADVIQRNVPNADVILTEVTLPYYMEGRAVQRIHDEIVAPARQRGYRDIYLAGASMGGMGVLMYEREHPNEMRGLILMAPYMGDASLIKEIKAAGGLAQWNAGPIPPQLNRDNVPREEWRLVQSWLGQPERTRNVWLICGQRDQFYGAAQMIAPLLPAGHYIEPQGGHAWAVWMQGAQEAFAKVANTSARALPAAK